MLLVAPGALPEDAEPGRMLLSFATQLGAGTGGPTVVVGDPASDTAGGLVALVRKDDTANKAVSSVDDASSPLGAAHRGADRGRDGGRAQGPLRRRRRQRRAVAGGR